MFEGGCVISHFSGPSQTQTGQLDRRTLLHKRYVILRTIGRGGMGAVYLAKDMKRQGTICAVKEMSLSMIPPAEQPQAIQNFKIEAKMLWGLNHPNLPAFTGFFTENQRYFLVMEYIDGITLEDLLERNQGPFSERRVLGWARQLCDVLEYLHSQNPPIIFRDMKPGNVMLTRTGHIKLIDFGIARFFRPTGAQDTQHLGTPGFAPPEQYGTSQTDVRSDIYSLGMTLFLLLTNHLSEQTFSLKDVRSFNPKISLVVARALEKATAYDPDDRYQSVSEFRAALLGVGFVFDSGELAMTVQELAELCTHYPDEAADYLAAGEIEAWLHELGEDRLARETQRIRSLIDNPQDAIELFIQAIAGRSSRGLQRPTANVGETNGTGSTSRTTPGWLKMPSSPVQVSPRILDFGHVYPGISAPLTLTISGQQGNSVSGNIHTAESWITLDQTRFDGAQTSINVRINSTRLNSSNHYTGIIIVSSVINGSKKDIRVTVEADVLPAQSNNALRVSSGKTRGADLNEEDDEEEVYDEFDALTVGSNTLLNGQAQQMFQNPRSGNRRTSTVVAAPDELFTTAERREHEHLAKYGDPDTETWEPLNLNAKQAYWFERGRIFFSSLMAGSLWYLLVMQMPGLNTSPPLPPDPAFILVLMGIIPATALGSLLTAWSPRWSVRMLLTRFLASKSVVPRGLFDRLLPAMGAALLSMSTIHLLWQLLRLPDLAPWQLFLQLLIAVFVATYTSQPKISALIVKHTRRTIALLTSKVALTCAGLIGALLGGGLVFGFPWNWFTIPGILVGVGIIMGLERYVESLMRPPPPPPDIK